MEAAPGASVSLLPFSSAHCCLAPSSWRRLLMHALVWEVARALTKFGIAMAANRPIIATTIMISTRVKPALRDVFIFITSFCLSCLFQRREQRDRRVINLERFCPLIANRD